jgi:hypothetical protein
VFSACLLAYVVIRYTNTQNAIQMTWALITFIAALVGVTVAGENFANKDKIEEK